MMSSMANKIEMYLKVMLDRAKDGVIEVQRSELADIFDCVPSQINYVLGTRFTPAHGYTVESRRGGGGFVRIIRLTFEPNTDFQLLFGEIIGDELPQNQGEGLIERLYQEGILTKREGKILKQICSTSFLNEMGLQEQGFFRAKIIQVALASVMREDIY